MIIYHGSNKIIEKPEFGKGNTKNDYGLGFYCTENIELAKEWACSTINVNGYANKYNIDLSSLKILDLTDSKFSILNWLAILLQFRTFDVNTPISKEAKNYILKNFYIDVEEYDVIIGYRADDSYFSFAKDFINNTISIEQLSKAMLLGKLGVQIVLKSKIAFEKIKFVESELAISDEYYTKRIARDKNARNEYFENKTNLSANGIYVIDIIRRGIKDGSDFLQ